jgi:hypothetical protein
MQATQRFQGANAAVWGRGVPVDCFDNTTGSGTAGTANFWIKDMGLTQNRPGLCKKATP